MKDNLLILVGPTAIGKTAVSTKLAELTNGEIISADSMQIYKYMDIGTAKITLDEMGTISHHLIDIVHPDEDFSVSDYKEKAVKLIKKINASGGLPIVAGGTGLYINSLVYNLNFTKVPSDEKIRKELEEKADLYGNEYLVQKLQTIDKESSKKIFLNDRKRLIRAIEIYKLTGKPMSEHNKNFRIPIDDYNLVMIGLNMDREKLYNRINNRVEIMVEEGLVNEVKNLLNMGYNTDLVSMQGIGYKEIIRYLQGDISFDQAIEQIKQGSRNYAKRQLTWFRRDDRIQWYDIEEFSSQDLLVSSIYKSIKL